MTDSASTSRILTLVFSDLADAMALKTRLGDQVASDLITRHRAHVSVVSASTCQRLEHTYDQPIRWQTRGSYSVKGFDGQAEIS